MEFNFLSKQSYLSLSILVCITIGQMSVSFAQATSCKQLIDSIRTYKPISSGQFLHQQNSSLHISKPVEGVVKSIKSKNNVVLAKPSDKIEAWLKYLERSYSKVSRDKLAIVRIKQTYLDQHVTKANEVPESFFELQTKIAREKGQGEHVMNSEARKKLVSVALVDQKKSLETWLDYFFSEDSSMYPMWLKYWSINGVVKLGKFDPALGIFSSRSKGQMSLFPDLNREAFAMVIDAIVKKTNGDNLWEINDLTFLNYLDTHSFSKLYGRALYIATSKLTDTSSVDGVWKVYKQNSDHKPLVQSLKGQNTGWCTAGAETAKSQLKDGDFHVFYSLDQDGNATVPRVAIRMEAENISEVRGIGKDQNLDPVMAESSVVKNKLNEFGSEGLVYAKKNQHMKMLTDIEKLHKNQLEISSKELKFLYEIDEQIIGFGYERDPRVAEILGQRDPRTDLSKIFNIDKSKISLEQSEVLQGGIELHYGDLKITNEHMQGLKLPKHLTGSLNFDKISSIEGVILPDYVGGDLIMDNLVNAKNLLLPKTVNGKVFLYGLKFAETLVLSEHVGGSLDISQLEVVHKIVLPLRVGGDFNLTALKTAKNLKFPHTVGGTLKLLYLNTAENVIFPMTVRNLVLVNLVKQKNITLPKRVEENVYLNNLSDMENLVLPEYVGHSIYVLSPDMISRFSLPNSLKRKAIYTKTSQ